jgi:hypothetical protein
MERRQIMQRGITKKSLTKTVVVLALFGLLLGLSSVPAAAAEDPGVAPEWDLQVNVEDSTEPVCEASPTPATWRPDSSATYVAGNIVDRFSGPSLSVDFYVGLDFQPGTDTNRCDDSPAFYQPTGEVEAVFMPSTDPELSTSTVECDPACTVESLSLGTSTIGGTLRVADDAPGGPTVRYTARLKVTWTPAG